MVPLLESVGRAPEGRAPRNGKGLVPMSKRKKIILMLAKGGVSQSGVAAALHASKRDVSACAKAIRERGLTFDDVAAMGAAEVDGMLAPPRGPRESAYLASDMGPLIARKKRNRKLTVKMFWMEHCVAAEAAGKRAYSYQAFCEMFADAAERAGATRRLAHEPGAKAYIDWAGDTAWLTDRLTGARTRVYVLVVALLYSGRFWAQGFTDMKQRSWQEGQARALEDFGGVPRMLVPDNAATATDRSSVYVTVVNAEYQRFAEHYGAAVVPARARRPRDKAVAESTVDLVERWVVAPVNETTFHTLGKFNGFCLERTRWLNAHPFSAREGSRDSVYEAEERPHMQPLPAERYEMCEWRSRKVAPDYHVTVDYMRYSVPFRLIGEQVDVRLTDTAVTVMAGGEAVAEHGRLRGRKGQYSTVAEHMLPTHAAMDSPWSPERFSSWAHRIGAETGAAVDRLLASRPVVEQAFVPARNILGLSKSYSPELLERACARSNALGAVPSYTALKNAILAIRAADAEARASGRPPEADGGPVDRAKSAGRLRGDDAYRRGGDRGC